MQGYKCRMSCLLSEACVKLVSSATGSDVLTRKTSNTRNFTDGPCFNCISGSRRVERDDISKERVRVMIVKKTVSSGNQ
ncbi:hypothetical protein E4T56_gene18339 [Termitomyces sp. T112]|nr:hypothetical protein E4T56_gene18339 [Termitomyces sp. T112]